MKRFTQLFTLLPWHRMPARPGVLVFGAGVILAMALVPSVVEGTVPPLINFQGILKDGSGNPVPDASYSVTFTIYETPTGGTPLWTETQSVSTADGLFAVFLGASNPVPDTAFKSSDRWLGIAVSPDPEMPRQRLVSVGYAYRVNSVDSAWGGTIKTKVSIGPGHTNTGANAFVAGANNNARGNYSVVGGGGGASAIDSNSALGPYSTIGGGRRNATNAPYGTIGGGNGNSADTSEGTTIGGGKSNTAIARFATVGGGELNTASSFWATIGGGYANSASGYFATVGGGIGNTASGGLSSPNATVSGGGGNTASAGFATVSGGALNTASDSAATVSGGYSNLASGQWATVSGGAYNRAHGQFSVVSGGGGTAPVDSNSALGDYATISGGKRITANGVASAVSGGDNIYAYGDYAAIGGGRNNAAMDSLTTVGGGGQNLAGSYLATVGGGFFNIASGTGSTIGGGFSNNATDTASTVGGGFGNTASGLASTVGGGSGNRARGQFSFVGGGGGATAADSNSASGDWSAIPGGRANVAAGNYSFAAGRRASALGSGSFVWADGKNFEFANGDSNTFVARATGGVYFVSGIDLLGSPTAGAYLSSGASAWAAISDSNMKRNIRTLEGKEMLEKVLQLPIKRWSYKAQDPSIEHIGPMAQDFYPLFKVGEDPLKISTIDPPGIALAAIQGLYQVVQEQKAENDEMKRELNDLRELVQKLLAKQKKEEDKKLGQLR